MGHIVILNETTKNPITEIGYMAGVCRKGASKSNEANYKRGLEVIQSHHDRCLEFVNVQMILSGYSARVIREWYTHIGGSPTRLQESTRYADESAFSYVIPPSVKEDSDACYLYRETMLYISDVMQKLKDRGVSTEDISMLLPLGMTTKVVDKRNLRNLVEMSHQRMCNRAYWEYRQLMNDIIFELKQYSEEWETLINMNIFCPKCDVLGECTEKKGCGRISHKIEH